MTTLTRLVDHLENNVGQVDFNHRTIISEYGTQLWQLIGYLRSLAGEWQAYVDAKETQANLMKFQVSVSQSSRGRLRFVVPKDQLEFLRSVFFTWTEIASLVARDFKNDCISTT